MSMTAVPEPIWNVDTTRCIACGDCAAICPVFVLTVLPPPCQTACPINTDVASYISLVKQQKFDEALASIRESNPFPGITARVCTHPCEKECTRHEIDKPVAIRALKRCAAEFGQDYEKPKARHIPARDERVAVVGSGPAGLMAAHDLARSGYQVTIFESLPVAGGMLYVGIPGYRLPKEIVQAEVGQLKDLGVDFRLNTRIGKDLTIDALFEQGYRAILLATGAHKSLKLQIAGEKRLKGLVDAISFLKETSLGRRKKIAGKAIVIGGGNAAIDSARALIRLGADEANIIYRRTAKEMPAIGSEVIEAEREGVKIHYLVAPSRILSSSSRVIGLECVRMEPGEPDVSGRRTPVPIDGSEFSMEADLVVSAIGQSPDLSFLSGNDRLDVSSEGLITVDTSTMATARSRIFAAGDNVTGPATVIDALAAGRRAAVSIGRYLRGEDLHGAGAKTEPRVRREKQIWWGEIAKGERQEMPKLSLQERSLNFDEVELGLARLSAVEEAKRCLECAIFASMDLESCCRESCRICERQCPENAIKAY